ncbi:MAG TPA: hypothetical protein VGW10_16090 [Solirubrobacteraceae bacterium]|nr:hypothetical protein [Solirubrobacteraceae bacterium]
MSAGTVLAAGGEGSAELAVVARDPGTSAKYTLIRLSGIPAGACNYHALVIPAPS